MSSASGHPEKSPQEGKEQAYKSDNPLSLNTGITILHTIGEKRKVMMVKYGILNAGIDVLIRISRDWLLDGKPNSVYALSDCKKSRISTVALTVANLYSKGLLEVYGSGCHGCRLYIPSKEAIAGITGIVSELQVA